MARTRHHGNKAKERTFGVQWNWLGTYPNWHDRMFHTKPRRVRERRAKHRVLMGDDDALWPLDKKPHKYYW